MPEIVVVDSSVAVKWFRRDGEDSVAQAWEILERHRLGEVSISVPALLHAEVANALLYRGTAPEVVAAAVRSLDEIALATVPVDAPLLELAVEIASADEIALYDAVFIALAQRLDAGLVTADRRQARSTRCRITLL